MNFLRFSVVILFIVAAVGCASNLHKKGNGTPNDNRVVMRLESNNYLLSRVEKEPSVFFIGTYGEDAVKEFAPPSTCNECIAWRYYYIYLVTPVSTEGTQNPLNVAIFSHAGRPGRKNEKYLIEVRKLPDADSEYVGADYLAIDLAAIGSSWNCVERPFHLDQWLYKPDVYPKVLLNKKGKYCYN